MDAPLERPGKAIVYLLGTCDTKLDEILFLRQEILKNDEVSVQVVDIGRDLINHDAIAYDTKRLAADAGISEDVSGLSRADLLALRTRQTKALLSHQQTQDAISGVIAIGGSGGTSVASTVMREALPVGLPKMMVSTIASGDTGPIVGETDIIMVNSVVDIAGLNQVLRDILSNAGAAIAASAMSYSRRHIVGKGKPGPEMGKSRIGISMFGVTTPAVTRIRTYLEENYHVEIYVFHATGRGGMAMERLIREGHLDGVLDLTTTEICDHITGGVMSAGPDRLTAAVERGIANVVSLGALDMTNFGPRDSVPPRYADRKLYEHNSLVTVMRSNKEELRQVGEFIVSKLRAAKKPDAIEVWLPRGGISMISTPDQVFADPKADEILFETIVKGLDGSDIKTHDDGRAINDAGFAEDIAQALARKMGLVRRTK